MVVELIEAGEFEAYPDALRFMMAVRGRRHSGGGGLLVEERGLFLQQIRLDTFAEQQGLGYDFLRPGLSLLEFFDADISGRDFAQGKPRPGDLPDRAPQELGAPPTGCFVVEDAVSGIQAAKAGEMAALGIARADDADALAAAHADLVVTSLDEVDVQRLADARLAARDQS